MFTHNNCVEIKRCLACDSDNLQLVLDLNFQPLANSYKIDKEEIQEIFPLAINHCKACHHVQLTHAVNPDLMFKDYLYVSGTSQTMKEYFKWFANFSVEYFKFNNGGVSPNSIFDIGCNDGSQLNQYLIKTYGIDPAENLHDQISKKHKVYLGYFNSSFLDVKEEKNYDIIVAQNVFAHNYNPLDFLQTAKSVMLDSSLLFIQTSQADMIVNNEFDTIYHEHISFYNTNSMNEICKRAGLFLIDAIKCPLHGNSYIFVVSRVNKRHFHVQNLINMERNVGLLTDETYKIYAERCITIVNDMVKEIQNYRKNGYTIVGYGAAAKGMTLLNYSHIEMEFIVDDNPLKQNRYTPRSNIPIVSSNKISTLGKDKPVLFVPLAWNFFDEIRRRIKNLKNDDHDKFLIYFPNTKVIK